MAAGHLLLPYAAGASLPRQLAFWALTLAVGALRGWRDASIREESPARTRRRVAITAVAASVLALLAYAVVHGTPRVP